MADDRPRDDPQGDALPDPDQLTRQFWGRLRVFAARRLRDASAAEDVAQETLRRVIEAMEQKRIESPEALPAFVFQTARHVCLFRMRSAARKTTAMERLAHETPAAANPDPLSSLIGDERRAAVRGAMERLDPGDRELLRLLYHEGLESVEVAGRLEISSGALRVRKHRALGRLGALLGESEACNVSEGAGTAG